MNHNMEPKEGKLSTKVQVAFVITGVFVGFLLTAQLRSAVPASSYPYDEFQAQQDLIKSYSDDQSVLKSKITNLRARIDELQQKSGQIIQKSNLETLQGLKKAIGLESLTGKGIEVVLNDGLFTTRDKSEDLNQSLIHAADLRDVINLLFSAQAQGISINDQRILASTPITSVGNTLLVNNFHILPPFKIHALGDSNVLLSRLSDPSALPDLQKRIQEHKIQWSLKALDSLVLPVYNGDFNIKQLQTYQPTNQ